MIKLGRAARLWNGPSLHSHKWRNGARFQWLANKCSGQACRWGFKPFICEMRLSKYKSTLINKGLNYFISVKLLILETIMSQRPWLNCTFSKQTPKNNTSNVLQDFVEKRMLIVIPYLLFSLSLIFIYSGTFTWPNNNYFVNTCNGTMTDTFSSAL